MVTFITQSREQIDGSVLSYLNNNFISEGNLVGIVSIDDGPESRPEWIEKLQQKNILICRMEFKDWDPIGRHIGERLSPTEPFPNKEEMQKLIDFGKQVIQREGVVLIHCLRGRHRSTSANYILKLMQNDFQDPEKCFKMMQESSQEDIWPNVTMIQIVVDILNQSQECVNVAQRFNCKKMTNYAKQLLSDVEKNTMMDDEAYESLIQEIRNVFYKAVGNNNAYMCFERAPGDKVFMAIIDPFFSSYCCHARTAKVREILEEGLGERAMTVAIATAWAPGDLM